MILGMAKFISVPDPDSRVDVGRCWCEAFDICQMSEKEVALIIGEDFSRLSKALRGVPGNALDFWKLALLPWRLWCVFVPIFLKEHSKWWLREWSESLKERAS